MKDLFSNSDGLNVCEKCGSAVCECERVDLSLNDMATLGYETKEIVASAAQQGKCCVVCGQQITEDSMVLSKSPEVELCHIDCCGSFLSKETSPAIRITIARMNGWNWRELLDGKVVCASCGREVITKPVVIADAVYHSFCACNGFLNKTINVTASQLIAAGVTDEEFSSVRHLLKKAGWLDSIKTKVKSWFSGIFNSIKSLCSKYDESLSVLEELANAPLGKESISDENKKFMQVLTRLEEINKQRDAAIQELMESEGISNLTSYKNAATESLMKYLGTLKNKARRYNEAIFQVKERVRRGTFSATEYRDKIELLLKNDPQLSVEEKKIRAEATKAKTIVQDLEIILDNVNGKPQEDKPEAKQDKIEPPNQATVEGV